MKIILYISITCIIISLLINIQLNNMIIKLFFLTLNFCSFSEEKSEILIKTKNSKSKTFIPVDEKILTYYLVISTLFSAIGIFSLIYFLKKNILQIKLRNLK